MKKIIKKIKSFIKKVFNKEQLNEPNDEVYSFGILMNEQALIFSKEKYKRLLEKKQRNLINQTEKKINFIVIKDKRNYTYNYENSCNLLDLILMSEDTKEIDKLISWYNDGIRTVVVGKKSNRIYLVSDDKIIDTKIDMDLSKEKQLRKVF